MHRIGLIVPSSNTTMETEVPALLRERERERRGDRFAVHSARMRMQYVTPEELRAMNAQTERATTELADMRPSVVATHVGPWRQLAQVVPAALGERRP